MDRLARNLDDLRELVKGLTRALLQRFDDSSKVYRKVWGYWMNDFKWRHFEGDIILGCVRWYCKYGISYRDLEEMMEELILQQKIRHAEPG